MKLSIFTFFLLIILIILIFFTKFRIIQQFDKELFFIMKKIIVWILD